MNTKQLKQKILDLAIRGKLVPQDPNDEPASVLLERIRAEKEQLIAQGKIKKSKSSISSDKPHYQNTPFQIPDTWEWVRLGKIADVINGRNQKSVENPNGKYPIYGSGGVMGYADDYICPEHCTIIGRKGTINNPILVETKFWNVDTAFGIWPNIQIDYLYFHYFCKSFNFKSIDKSTTLPSLTKTNIELIQVPLPPINEQKRIVAEIEKWFALIDELETNKQDLQQAIKQVKNKILDLAIHGKLVPQDPNDEPAIDLLRRINPNFTPCDTSHYQNIPLQWQVVPMKMLCDLSDGKKQNGVQRINLDVKFLRGKGEGETLSAGKYVPAKSTMILVDGENSGEIFTTAIDGYQGTTFKLLDISKEVYKPFILYVIKSYQRQFRENKVGSAIPHLNKKLFKEIELIVPPYREQQLIVEKISEIFTTINNISAEL